MDRVSHNWLIKLTTTFCQFGGQKCRKKENLHFEIYIITVVCVLGGLCYHVDL